MNKTPAIIAKNISKHYSVSLGKNDSIMHTLSGGIRFTNSRKNTTKDKSTNAISAEFICLNNINFEIFEGETIGIIGKNGSGKSTLLKILSEVTAPTTGEINIYGTTSAILEVSMGLHPELSGRENIFLSGTLLGLSKKQIKEKLQDIIDYSDLTDFIDIPVKKYSSGMSTRLAFAVAAFLDSDILFLDEALSMGDSAFRIKCLKKIESLIKSGKTIVLVTHDLHEILKYCDRVMYLCDGEIISFGDPLTVIAEYLQHTTTGNDKGVITFVNSNIQSWDNIKKAPGNEDIKIKKICVRSRNKKEEDKILTSDDIIIEIEYWKKSISYPVNFGIILYHYENKIMACGTVQYTEETNSMNSTGLYKAQCIIPGNLLSDTNFSIDFIVLKDLESILLRLPRLISFKVYPDEKNLQKIAENTNVNFDILTFKGPLTPLFDWKFEKTSELTDH